MLAVTPYSIEQDFQKKVSQQISIVPEGIGRFRVFTPFRFDDGDHLAIVLRQHDANWVLSDEAHTFMHLTYDIDEQDLHRGNRQKIISDALSVFHVEDRDGELVLNVPDHNYGDALYSFVQALLKITDVAFLTRERVQNTFAEDFRSLFTELIPENRRAFDWHDNQHDPEGKYSIDCRINGIPRPIFVHALLNDSQTRDATITLHQFEKWEIPFNSLAIFSDQETINRKVLARFSDVCDKQFSSLKSNQDRIERFVKDAIPTNN